MHHDHHNYQRTTALNPHLSRVFFDDVFLRLYPAPRMTDNSEAAPQVTDRGTKPCKLNYCCSRCFSNEMSSFFYWEHFGKGIAMTTSRRIGDF